MLHDVGELGFAKDIWDASDASSGTFSTLHTIVHLRELTTTTKKKDVSTQEYIARIQETIQKVKKGGIGFADKPMASFMLLGLPREYEGFIRSLEDKDDELTSALVV